ncbi:hypothetical protein BDP27DRAFT_1426948 [Rhodocollybia butyracea]|uniref:Uncharacterized protein n=1 Tax=Rhodocollybia butyracea TaxID=206335 RepID=A0A9P5PJS2_9AGAR|nr:hypothetical protein BDP27DRAFT_1426948 [Rhodocollybia butyracea]
MIPKPYHSNRLPHRSFVSSSDHSVSGVGVSSASTGHPRMIRKPRGQVSRLARGGYNLDEAVGWTVEQSDELKKYIKHAVEAELDCTLPFTRQPRSSIISIRQAALFRFPWLMSYTNLWVVNDLVRRRLQLRQSELKKRSEALLATEARAWASKKSALEAAAAAL